MTAGTLFLQQRAYSEVEGGEAELVIEHLRKQYGVGGKLAVRDLCLRIRAGECFGFLGVNGAGKSTTFSMLTGATVPTSGDALLRGMSILTSQDEIRKLVGFCPQHDAIEALLTAREVMVLYARIKGLAASEIGPCVAELLAELDLGMFADKPSGTLSGGVRSQSTPHHSLSAASPLHLRCISAASPLCRRRNSSHRRAA